MIDLSSETLLTPGDVIRLLPRRSDGKRVHISAVHRWMSRSNREGRILESIKIGGTRYTSIEALQRYGLQVLSHANLAAPEPSSPRRRQRQADRAAQAVKEILAGSGGQRRE